MNKSRTLSIAAAVALCGSLAACGSSKNGTSAAAGATTPLTVATTAPATSGTATQPTEATPTASAPVATSATPATTGSPTAGHSVSDLLATVSGQINEATAPPAKPEWVARVQPLTPGETRLESRTLNLLALVDQAARDHDTSALVRISNNKMTAARLSAPGIMDNVATLLEKTHPDGTDGLTFPAFEMGASITVPANAADLKALGVSSPADYHGIATMFYTSMGSPLVWQGVSGH